MLIIVCAYTPSASSKKRGRGKRDCRKGLSAIRGDTKGVVKENRNRVASSGPMDSVRSDGVSLTVETEPSPPETAMRRASPSPIRSVSYPSATAVAASFSFNSAAIIR